MFKSHVERLKNLRKERAESVRARQKEARKAKILGIRKANKERDKREKHVVQNAAHHYMLLNKRATNHGSSCPHVEPNRHCRVCRAQRYLEYEVRREYDSILRRIRWDIWVLFTAPDAICGTVTSNAGGADYTAWRLHVLGFR